MQRIVNIINDMRNFYAFRKMYRKCKADKDTYKQKFQSKYKSGGEPYKNYKELYKFLEKAKISEQDKILEIGTGFGFATAIFLMTTKGMIDTFEEREDHSQLARENLEKFCSENNLDIERVNFYATNFEESAAKKAMPFSLPGQKYQIIFFDGYSPKKEYLKIFEDYLDKSGYLITANSHLSKVDPEYFLNLSNKEKWEYIEKFGDTKIFKKLW